MLRVSLSVRNIGAIVFLGIHLLGLNLILWFFFWTLNWNWLVKLLLHLFDLFLFLIVHGLFGDFSWHIVCERWRLWTLEHIEYSCCLWFFWILFNLLSMTKNIKTILRDFTYFFVISISLIHKLGLYRFASKICRRIITEIWLLAFWLNLIKNLWLTSTLNVSFYFFTLIISL